MKINGNLVNFYTKSPLNFDWQVNPLTASTQSNQLWTISHSQLSPLCSSTIAVVGPFVVNRLSFVPKITNCYSSYTMTPIFQFHTINFSHNQVRRSSTPSCLDPTSADDKSSPHHKWPENISPNRPRSDTQLSPFLQWAHRGGTATAAQFLIRKLSPFQLSINFWVQKLLPFCTIGAANIHFRCRLK